MNQENFRHLLLMEYQTVAYLGIFIDIRKDFLEDLYGFHVIKAAKVAKNWVFQLIPSGSFAWPLGEPVYHFDDAERGTNIKDGLGRQMLYWFERS